MSGDIAGTGRRFRFDLRSGDVIEAVFQDGELEAESRYVSHDIPPSFVGSLFWKHTLDEVTRENTDWYEVTAEVPSPSTEEESHPALTAAAPPANFVIDTGTVGDLDDYPAYLLLSDPAPDAEESIDEYVARIDEGVVPAAAVNEAENRRRDTRDAELALHRDFYTAALAAHAESSPNKVEVLFGGACDRLRRGLRELATVKCGEEREEDSASSQTVGPPPVAV